MLLILLISNPKDSFYSGEIIINKQFEHSLEIDVSFSSYHACHITIFSQNTWLQEYVYYYDIDIRNIYIFRKNTKTFPDIHDQIISIAPNSTNILANNFVDFDSHQIRTMWVYLAKYLSTPKYSLPNDICCSTKPKTSM